MMKQRPKQTSMKPRSENADKKGNIRKSNLTQRQEKGVRDLKEKTKYDGDR